MNKTEINWTDLSWNPLSGCSKISPGCDYCYAHTIAENKAGTRAFPNGFGLTFRPHKLVEPLKVKIPTLIFANSMSDFFHPGVPDEYRDRIFDAIRAAPQHRYQVLTKRPALAAKYFATRDIPDCVWMGVTIENRAMLAERLLILQDLPAKTRFLSIEPILEDLGQIDLAGIDWVIVGGESGHHLMDPDVRSRRGLADRVNGKWEARTDRMDWVRSIRDQCLKANVAFWFKQWGGAVGPLAGRSLDGTTWDGLPTHALPGMVYQHRHLLPLD
ncbi:MAG: phage Gp37/Gp68 family protein [Bryobacteraceae bacterium]